MQPNQPPRHLPKTAVLACGVLLVLFLFVFVFDFLLLGGRAVLLVALVDIGVAAVIVLVGYGIGGTLLRFMWSGKRGLFGEVWVAVGLGLFVLAIGGYALAALHLLTRFWVGLLLGAGGVLSVPGCWRTIRILRDKGGMAAITISGTDQVLLWCGIGLCLAIQLLGSVLPPCWYDALEYHLGVPWEYAKHGGFCFLPGNVFSNLPFNTEMLYMPAMILRGGISAKLIHFLFGVMSAGAMVSIGSRLGCRTGGLLAALLFLVEPGVMGLASSADIDLAVAFYLLTCVVVVGWWFEDRRRRWLILLGLLSGAGLGCKWSAGYLILLPMLIVVFVRGFTAGDDADQGRPKRQWSAGFGGAATVGAVALVALAPWLVKNLLYHGNPVFPFLYGGLGGREWSPAEAAIFQSAIEPTFYSGLLNAWQSLWGEGLLLGIVNLWKVFTGGSLILTLGLLLLPAVFFARDRLVPAVAAVGLTGYLAWLLLTHQSSRFIVPAFPMIVLPAALWVMANAQKQARVALGGLALSLAILGALPYGLEYAAWNPRGHLLQPKNHTLFHAQRHPHFQVVNMINRLPKRTHPRILLVAEAQVYGIRWPLEACTVFNRSSLIERYDSAGSAEGLRRELKREGFTHIFYNQLELSRLAEFYGEPHGWDDYLRIYEIMEELKTEGLIQLEKDPDSRRSAVATLSGGRALPLYLYRILSP